MMKKRLRHLRFLVAIFATAACISTSAQEAVITCKFNPAKVILPSSQYTPNEPYEASVWVFNNGERYNGDFYNHIWDTPSIDTDGRNWFDPLYNEGDVNGWSTQRAPFSSDEYYNGQKSYQWVNAEIMGEIYIRRTFTLSSLPAGVIYLACGHDDGPSEWYINGQLVHTVSDGWNNDEYVQLSDEHKALLKADGNENLIAVHVHQNWGGAYADCGLYEADMSLTTTVLKTVAGGEWPCRYYMLNYNSDIPVAEAGGWAADTEDESDWVESVGPMSNDQNMFLITKWPSQLRPILVRRHFTLLESDLASLDDTDVRLLCSYDENPKIYLNGTQIWSADGWNDNNYAEYNLSAEQKQLLRKGDNILAVSATQGGGGGHIDYGLQTVAPYTPSDSPTSIVPTMVDALPTDNRVFNLHGQYLGTSTENLPAGLYIVGGRKQLVIKK